MSSHSFPSNGKLGPFNLNDDLRVDLNAYGFKRTEPIRKGPKTGRNEQCPCKSGKKYKKCCLEKDG